MLEKLFSEMDPGQWVLLVMTLGGFIGTWLRDARKRRWDLEDRRMAREQSNTALVAVAQKAEKAENAATKAREEISVKLEENTQITKAAAHAANSVDQKFATLDRMIDEVRTTQQLGQVAATAQEAKKAAEEAKTAAQDTQSIVREKLGVHSGGETKRDT